MSDAQILVDIMTEEKTLVSRLIEVSLKEREGIINSNTSLLSESFKKKEEVKASMEMLERKRVALTGKRMLREIIQEVEQEEKSKLASLQFDLKVSAREVQAISKSNLLLFKQTLAFKEKLQRAVFGADGPSYNGSGQLVGVPPAGNFVSSSA
ncbi:MAG: flagellar protein FlgN [Firmicutes bacterium]|nr:flagellar protein FlgN [Bacillota bacterium]